MKSKFSGLLVFVSLLCADPVVQGRAVADELKFGNNLRGASAPAVRKEISAQLDKLADLVKFPDHINLKNLYDNKYGNIHESDCRNTEGEIRVCIYEDLNSENKYFFRITNFVTRSKNDQVVAGEVSWQIDSKNVCVPDHAVAELLSLSAEKPRRPYIEDAFPGSPPIENTESIEYSTSGKNRVSIRTRSVEKCINSVELVFEK